MTGIYSECPLLPRGSGGHNFCSFPKQCLCRLDLVCNDIKAAFEEFFEHAEVFFDFLEITHQGKERSARSETAFRFILCNYMFPSWNNAKEKPFLVMDGAILALEQILASVNNDAFVSEIGPGTPQPCNSDELYPICIDQPWKQFLATDEWVRFAKLCLNLNVVHVNIMIRILNL
jgi:hypothetical protein